jgi:hypothetical protein
MAYAQIENKYQHRLTLCMLRESSVSLKMAMEYLMYTNTLTLCVAYCDLVYVFLWIVLN